MVGVMLLIAVVMLVLSAASKVPEAVTSVAVLYFSLYFLPGEIMSKLSVEE